MRSPIFLAGIFACLLSSQAHAYIDPGVGSMLVQGILAGGAGALFFVRLFWGRIKGIFATRRPLHEKYEKK
jgi:hypothetical protein